MLALLLLVSVPNSCRACANAAKSSPKFWPVGVISLVSLFMLNSKSLPDTDRCRNRPLSKNQVRTLLPTRNPPASTVPHFALGRLPVRPRLGACGGPHEDSHGPC